MELTVVFSITHDSPDSEKECLVRVKQAMPDGELRTVSTFQMPKQEVLQLSKDLKYYFQLLTAAKTEAESQLSEYTIELNEDSSISFFFDGKHLSTPEPEADLTLEQARGLRNWLIAVIPG